MSDFFANRRGWWVVVGLLAALAAALAVSQPEEVGAALPDEFGDLTEHYRITVDARVGSRLVESSVVDVWFGDPPEVWIESERDPDGRLVAVRWSSQGVVSERDAVSDFVTVRSASTFEGYGPDRILRFGRAVASGVAEVVTDRSGMRVTETETVQGGTVTVDAIVDPESLLPSSATVTADDGADVLTVTMQFTRVGGVGVPDDVLDEITGEPAGTDVAVDLDASATEEALAERGLRFPGVEPVAGFRFVKGLRLGFAGLIDSGGVGVLYERAGGRSDGLFDLEIYVTPLSYIEKGDGRVDLAVDPAAERVDVGWAARYDAAAGQLAFDTDTVNVIIRFNVDWPERKEALMSIARALVDG